MYHMDNRLVAAAMRSSDPNFPAGGRLPELGVTGNKNFHTETVRPPRQNTSCFSASQNLFFSEKNGKTCVFPKKSNFSEEAFSTSQKLSDCPFRLLHSLSPLSPTPDFILVHPSTICSSETLSK